MYWPIYWSDVRCGKEYSYGKCAYYNVAVVRKILILGRLDFKSERHQIVG